MAETLKEKLMGILNKWHNSKVKEYPSGEMLDDIIKTVRNHKEKFK